MSSKQGGKLKPLKQPKSEKKAYDEFPWLSFYTKMNKDNSHGDISVVTFSVICGGSCKNTKEERGGEGTQGIEGEGIPEGCIWRHRPEEEWKEIICVTCLELSTWTRFCPVTWQILSCTLFDYISLIAWCFINSGYDFILKNLAVLQCHQEILITAYCTCFRMI
ncbi:uncharacterized protein LOC141818543 [Curcuma longa]|uniref:uncharacterized protein LOC141818543 n=1 Tax=Curcuma longa TaxID=136217 RepID=UPI003D9E6234